MDHTITIAIAIILTIALIVAVLIFLSKKETNRKNELLNTMLTNVANDSKLLIDKREAYRNRLIAVDTRKMMLVYVELKDNEPEYDIIALDQVKNCDVMSAGNNVQPGSKGDRHISLIVLQLLLKTDTKIDLCFYSEQQDGTFEMQPAMQKAKEWRDLLMELKTRTVNA